MPKRADISSLIYLLAFIISGCNTHGVSTNEVTSQKIDSLIEVQEINDRCTMVKFGADAVTAINTLKGIVVIDAGISSGLTARYRRIIKNKFQQNNFSYVINTHGHPDHYGGNSIFPESKVVAHKNCIQEIAEQWNDPQEVIKGLSKTVDYYKAQLQSTVPDSKEWDGIFTQKIRYLDAYSDAKDQIPIKKPDITISDSLVIDTDNVTFEMKYFGRCHSSSDILIYVPEMNILFVGDLFSKYGRPGINGKLMPDRDRWRQAVRWIEKRMASIKVIIDGHGEILSADCLKSFTSNILKVPEK